MIKKWFYKNYDLDSTSFKYGKLLEPIQGVRAFKTNGASTTLVAYTANEAPFREVSVGDVIVWNERDGAAVVRKVTSKASDDEIGISGGNVNLTVVNAWWHQRWRIGTAASDGWHLVHMMSARTLFVDIPTIAAAGGVDMQVEGRGQEDHNPVVLIPSTNYPSSGASDTHDVPDEVVAIRVGLKGGSGFGGTDDINIWLEGRLLAR